MTNNMTITFPTIDAHLDHDDTYAAFRDLLIDPSADLSDLTPLIDRDAILTLIHDFDDESRSMLLLSFSLCPLHACDYAICFDDDDAECESLRACFPSHDT